MIYQSVSIDQVISRIIRNTKISDSSALNDMFEWIPEAMEMMQTKYELYPEFADIDIDFHQGRLPCGLTSIEAVEWCGQRLPFSSTSRSGRSRGASKASPGSQQVFQSVRGNQINPVTGNSNIFLSESLEAIIGLPEACGEYYQLKMGWIVTSFSDGKVRVHYLSIPTDERGLPLVPDNSNYKEAIYYYVRAKLIGSGMFKDTVLTEQACMQRFEVYAGRAIGEISYPSVDRMQEMVNNQVRLVFPQNYWENYGHIGMEGSYGY